MIDDRDPLQILREATDPAVAVWALGELTRAGFADVAGIARDCGWDVEVTR